MVSDDGRYGFFVGNEILCRHAEDAAVICVFPNEHGTLRTSARVVGYTICVQV